MLAFWLGGSGSGATIPGYRSILAFWLGGSGAIPGIPPGGYRSILALWLGGAASSAEIPPIPEIPGGGGWGRIRLKHIEIQLREELLADFTEEECSAILAAIAWCLK
jgi:hypothetical protein